MQIKKGQEIKLDITDIAFGGKGLAKIDGYPIFVSQTMPNDTALVRIFKKKKNYAEAKLLEIINPSSDRIAPICKYFSMCGGCKWQFIKYENQLFYKRNHVLESIEHIGLIKDVLIHPTIAANEIYGYRNKMEFSCSERKWLMPYEMNKEKIESTISTKINANSALGLHVPGTFYKVLDIDACHLQDNYGNKILNDVNQFIKNSDLPVYGLKSHIGFWRFLMLRNSSYSNNWMVNIITAYKDTKELEKLADFLSEKYPQISSIVNNITSKKANIAVGEYEELLYGNSYIQDKIGKYLFNISSKSFFQTNTKTAKILYDVVKDYADLNYDETIFDLYCGTGTIGIYISQFAKKIIGIEMVEDAVIDAKNNCKLNNISNCSFISGDVKEILSTIDLTPDIIIIDPPRDGIHKDVIKQIFNISPKKIIYVSCNPATMARDFLILKEKYDILKVQPVDMFPHTHHIEAVAKLEKK